MDGGCAVSHIATHRQGFAAGYTAVTRAADAVNFTGIGFGVLRLAAGETWRGCIERETAWLLMSGAARVKAGDLEAALARTSLFDESASCLHAAAGTLVELHASVATELTVYDCLNMRGFAPRIFRPADVPNEPRQIAAEFVGQNVVRGYRKSVLRHRKVRVAKFNILIF